MLGRSAYSYPAQPSDSRLHAKDLSMNLAADAPKPLKGSQVALLYGFAVLSGAAALMYEVSWTKLLALTFGRSTLAATAVLGGFMVGMGIGAWLYHKVQARIRNDLKIYAVLEIAIALITALMTPVLIALPEFFASSASLVQAGLTMDLFRTGLVVALVLLPSAMMGATFPALCTVLIRSREGVSRHLGPIYGLNTVGAALGAMTAGFFLMEAAGLRGTVYVANSINLGIGLFAGWISLRSSPQSIKPATPIYDDEALLKTSLSPSVSATALFVSGFATLAYEIIWFRALRYLFGNSSYSLTVMLVVFLIGLGLGGLLAGRLQRRHQPERLLAYSQFGIAFMAILAIVLEYSVLRNPEILANVSVFAIATSHLTWEWRLLISVSGAFMIMLPPTLLMGLCFPVATRLFLGDLRLMGKRVGTAYFLSNLGSILGAGVAAFILLPELGTIHGTLAIAFFNLFLGVLILSSLPKNLGGRASWAIPPALFLGAAWIVLPGHLPFPTLHQNLPPMDLLWNEEGDVATVQVWSVRGAPELRGIFVDGTSIGETQGMRKSIWGKQRILAHLPMALAPQTKTSLNIGLGSASTLQALASYPQMEKLDVVEISQSVVDGTRDYFAEAQVLEDPRVHLEVEDIAHYLLKDDFKYELIISDGKIAEGFSGNELMLSREFYQQAKRRLTPHGIFIQWLPLTYPSKAFESILRTFTKSFQEVEVFFDYGTGLYLLGSEQPIGQQRVNQYQTELAQEDMDFLGIPNISALMGRWMAGGTALTDSVGQGRINNWDHSASEFAINRANAQSLFEAAAPNLAVLLNARSYAPNHPYLSFDSAYSKSEHMVSLALYALLQNRPAKALRIAEQAALINPSDPTPQLLLESIQ